MRPDVRRNAALRVLLVTALLLAGTARAVDPDTRPVPFLATYATSLNGMPLGIDLRLRLSPAERDTWQLELEAGSRMMDYSESSAFHWNDCRAEPQRYRFEFKGFGVDRKLWLDFDHAKKIATGTSRKGPISFAFPDDVTDELGLMYAARCELQRGAEQVTFNVATTNGMRPLSYEVAGHETIRTPYGKLDAIRVERVRKGGEKRRSTLWVAPSLGYIMVKMEHVEKLGVRGTASLKALEGITPAAPATAPAPAAKAPGQ